MVSRGRAEAVEMVAKRNRFLPHLFRWRGCHYEVEAVERCWTVVRWKKGERHFRVRCSAGIFELCQDLSTGAWLVRRTHLQPAQARVLQGSRQPHRSKAPVQSARRNRRRGSPQETGQAFPARSG